MVDMNSAHLLNASRLYNFNGVKITLTIYNASAAIINIYNKTPGNVVTIVNNTTNAQYEHMSVNEDDMQYPICNSNNYTIKISRSVNAVPSQTATYIKIHNAGRWTVEYDCGDECD